MTRKFQYRVRTAAHWEARMLQGQLWPSPLAQKLRGVLSKLRYAGLRRRRELEAGRLGLASEPMGETVSRCKLTLASRCAECGCRRDSHCLEPRMHFAGLVTWTCLTEHCEGLQRAPGTNSFVPCDCMAFRSYPGEPLKLKRPTAGDFTPCAACGCPKRNHCKAQRREDELSGFFVGSVPHVCSHFDAVANPTTYKCNSTACASWDDDAGQFCKCKKFVSPWLRKKAAARSAARNPRKRLS